MHECECGWVTLDRNPALDAVEQRDRGSVSCARHREQSPGRDVRAVWGASSIERERLGSTSYELREQAVSPLIVSQSHSDNSTSGD